MSIHSPAGTMQTQKYSVNQYMIASLLTWVRDGEIAIPEIQRPFVWSGTQVLTGIDSREELVENLRMNCVPESIFDGNHLSYQDFLIERRKLMAVKIREYFSVL